MRHRLSPTACCPSEQPAIAPPRPLAALRRHEKSKSRSQVRPWQRPPLSRRVRLQGTPVRCGMLNCSSADVKRDGGQRTAVSSIPPPTVERYA